MSLLRVASLFLRIRISARDFECRGALARAAGHNRAGVVGWSGRDGHRFVDRRHGVPCNRRDHCRVAYWKPARSSATPVIRAAGARIVVVPAAIDRAPVTARPLVVKRALVIEAVGELGAVQRAVILDAVGGIDP